MLQLLDYLAAYPDDSITYRSSSMVLVGHANATYLNMSKACSCTGAHIMISEDVTFPPHNGPVLTISQIINNIM